MMDVRTVASARYVMYYVCTSRSKHSTVTNLTHSGREKESEILVLRFCLYFTLDMVLVYSCCYRKLSVSVTVHEYRRLGLQHHRPLPLEFFAALSGRLSRGRFRRVRHALQRLFCCIYGCKR